MNIINKVLTEEQIETYSACLNEWMFKTIDLPAHALKHYADFWSCERLKDTLKRGVLTCAEIDGKMVGLVLGTGLEGGVGTIIWVLVSPEHQGLGIGRSLLSFTLGQYSVSGAHKVKLTVPEKKTTEFYLKCGWNLEGYHPKHWWEKDFWAMGYQLK